MLFQNVEKVVDKLSELIIVELEKCEKEKKVPSKELLDTIETLSKIKN